MADVRDWARVIGAEVLLAKLAWRLSGSVLLELDISAAFSLRVENLITLLWCASRVSEEREHGKGRKRVLGSGSYSYNGEL